MVYRNVWRGVAAVVLIPLAAYGYLKVRQALKYKTLKEVQQNIIATYEQTIEFMEYEAHTLPSFRERLIAIPDFLPESTFCDLRREVVNHTKTERSYLPGHKKGGTISYEELHYTMPKVVALYHSQALRDVCAAIVGQPVRPTPINDQSSCSILCYERPGDHIGWHYDYNFYNGRHFTVLLPIVNEHNLDKMPSSADLVVKQRGRDIVVPTPPNKLIMFEGAHVLHKVTQLGDNETRIILSMTFCTDSSTSLVKSISRRVKDIGFFGIRALWT